MHIDSQKQILNKIESLSETEKMELFNVEELEVRLEMAAISVEPISGNGVCWVAK